MQSVAAGLQSRLLVQVGLVLFLCALLVGLAVPAFGVPRLGLSAHLLGLLQGIFLMLIGALRPRLRLGRAGWATVGLLIYGCLSAWLANVLAGIWRAGGALLPMAGGSAHGTFAQEIIIALALRSSAVTLLAAMVLLLWGTRGLVTGESTA